MEGASIAEALASIGRAFASPAKIAFIGYVVLAYAGKVNTNVCQFVVVTLAFLIVQVFHDDYLRIILNRTAERVGSK